MADGQDEDLSGTVLDEEFELTKWLGSGGYAAVYQGFQRSFERKVAVKILHRTILTRTEAERTEIVNRFVREPKAAVRAANPHIVTIFASGEFDSPARPYLVMELLSGQTLREAIAGAGMKTPRVLHIGAQIATALEAAHQAGVVHRDLKPENIFLIRHDDDHDYVKVLDFGIAKLPSASPDATGLTADERILGTAWYMSPEQIKKTNAVDARTDIYALGVILHEMLAGAPPFPGSMAVAMVGHLRDPPPDLDAQQLGTRALNALLRSMLAKEAAERPPTMAEVARRLAALSPTRTAEGGHGPPPAPKPAPEKKSAKVIVGPRWRAPLLYGGALAVLGSVGVTSYLLSSLRPTDVARASEPVTRPPDPAPAGSAVGAGVPPVPTANEEPGEKIGRAAALAVAATPLAPSTSPKAAAAPAGAAAAAADPDALVEAAQKELQVRQYNLAIDHARAVLASNTATEEHKADAHWVIGAARCNQNDRSLARAEYEQLTGPHRATLHGICKKLGIDLP